MKRFEHLGLQVTLGELGAELEQLSSDGWEVVAALEIGSWPPCPTLWLVCKRPVTTIYTDMEPITGCGQCGMQRGEHHLARCLYGPGIVGA